MGAKFDPAALGADRPGFGAVDTAVGGHTNGTATRPYGLTPHLTPGPNQLGGEVKLQTEGSPVVEAAMIRDPIFSLTRFRLFLIFATNRMRSQGQNGFSYDE
jgi:hypothetical protein